MLYNKLIEVIARDSRQMAVAWMRGMKTSEFAESYHKLDDEEMKSRCQDVYDNLGKWLESDFKMLQGDTIYTDLGRQRYKEGIPLCQVHFALHLTKKVLWNHILSQGILNTSLEIYQAIDLFVRVQNFFDMASFYIIRGYMEEVFLQLGRQYHLDPQTLKAIFPEGSFMIDPPGETLKRGN